jgi:hypothetical protein
LSHTVHYEIPTRDSHLASYVFERNSTLIVKPYSSSLESLMGLIPDVVPRKVHIQVVPGGKRDYNVGRSKQNYTCTCVLFRTVSEIELYHYSYRNVDKKKVLRAVSNAGIYG